METSTKIYSRATINHSTEDRRIELVLIRSERGYQWHGPDDEDADVGGRTIKAAIAAAQSAWHGPQWDLQFAETKTTLNMLLPMAEDLIGEMGLNCRASACNRPTKTGLEMGVEIEHCGCGTDQFFSAAELREHLQDIADGNA